MTDFRVMFPDMEAEVIEAVLRANNGAVDATIDHLLAMSADNEAMARPPEQPMVNIVLKSTTFLTNFGFIVVHSHPRG